jgi:hypothetical protein
MSRLITPVELVRLYSNPDLASKRLLEAHLAAPLQRREGGEPASVVPQRVRLRLGAEVLNRVIAEYVAGEATTTLANRYGIGKGTLLRLLRVGGVTVRHQHRRS